MVSELWVVNVILVYQQSRKVKTHDCIKKNELVKANAGTCQEAL